MHAARWMNPAILAGFTRRIIAGNGAVAQWYARNQSEGASGCPPCVATETSPGIRARGSARSRR